MRNNHYRTATFTRKLLATAVGALLAQGATAQLSIEEVIVTAQKREQTTQDVPSSIAAISSELLARTNTTDFSDLSKISSGINITGGADGFGKVIRVRGIGTNSFVPAIRPAVGIFMDEVPLASPEAAYNNLADIERIEVLKGPQATLFGKEVSSGAISLFTRRPDTENISGYAEGNFGNIGRAEYRLGGNLPMGEMFAVRASYYSAERDGTVDNIVLGTEMGAVDQEGVRVRALFEPTDNFSAIVTYEKHDTEVTGSVSTAQQYGDLAFSAEAIRNPDGPSLLNVLDPFDRVNDNSNPSNRSTETENLYLNAEWAVSDSWVVNLVTSQQEWGAVVDGQFPTPEGILAADTAVGPYRINDFVNEPSSESSTFELRATYDSENLSSLVGVFYADTDLISFTPFSTAVGAIPAIGLEIKAAGLSDLRENVEEVAFFNHNIYTIREGLEFTFGFRVSEVEKTSVKGQLTGVGPFEELNNPLVPVTPWADDIPTQNDKWEDVTGTLKLTYWLNDELSVYGGWDRGFKAGGHNVCRDADGVPDCPDPFESEVADNYEVGFKGRFGGSLVWNGAAFYQVYSDYQVEIQEDDSIGLFVQNAASVEITGIETDLQWLVSDSLLLEANAAYIDARWDEYENADCLRPQFQAVACDPVTQTQDLSGERLNYTSPLTVNINATYSGIFGNGMSWYVRGEYAYKDDLFFFPDLDPELTADAYFLFNGMVGLRAADNSWDLMLWGKNLADEDYLVSGSRNRDATLNPAFGGTPVEGYRVTVGEQRTYGMTLRYRFNGG